MGAEWRDNEESLEGQLEWASDHADWPEFSISFSSRFMFPGDLAMIWKKKLSENLKKSQIKLVVTNSSKPTIWPFIRGKKDLKWWENR